MYNVYESVVVESKTFISVNENENLGNDFLRICRYLF